MDHRLHNQQPGDWQAFVALPLLSESCVVAQNDIEYYRARATEERERALASNQQDVAEIHLELARLYDALVNEPAIRPTLKLFGSKQLSA